MLCTRIDGPAGFFLPQVEAFGATVRVLPSVNLAEASRLVLAFNRKVESLVDGFDSMTDEIQRYAHVFERERPGVVHVWLDWPNAAAGIAALAVGVPRIVLGGRSLSPTHFAFLRTFMRPAYRELLKSGRVTFLNNSRAGADDYAAWIGVPPSRVDVVPNAVDPSEHAAPTPAAVAAFRARHALPEGTPVLGGVFRLMPEKRPDLWLAIAALVAKARPDARFLIVGGGPEMARVEASARELGIAGRLVLTGESPEVATALAVMSCFLLTSRVEGLPNVLLEAQMSGVRVVTSAVGGAPEALDAEGLAGVAVDSDEPGPYAQAVLALLADEAGAAAAREALPASVLARFSQDRMIAATLDAYGLGRAST